MSRFTEIIRLPDIAVRYDTDTRDLTLYHGDSTDDPTRRFYIYKHVGDSPDNPEYQLGAFMEMICDHLKRAIPGQQAHGGRLKEQAEKILQRVHKEQAQ